MDRLSYLHASDQEYNSDYAHTFDPRKNLNELFHSIPLEDVEMEKLKVYLRVRPNLAEETQQDQDTQVDILDKNSIILTAPTCSNTFKSSTHGIAKLSQKFTFSHIYGPTVTQEELFHSSTLGLVKDFIRGQNCLLFTYGATNSGKTFTVQGTPSDVGLLPRTLEHIFNTVGGRQYQKNDLKPRFFCSVTRLEEQDVIREEEKKESIIRIGSNLTSTFSQSIMSISKLSTSEDSFNSSQQLSEASRTSQSITEISRVSSVMDTHNQTAMDPDNENTVCAVFVSFAEVYNEYIFDLLDKMPTSKSNKRNPLILGEDRNGAIYIKGLNEVRVRTAEEALQFLNIGRQNLHFAATRLNHNSSRSHCIFTIKMVRLADADSPHVARVSMLSLCDLAGAERAGKTQSTQDRLKEAGNINTSLLTLSRCIDALRRNQMQKGHKKREVPVPYRDSKLTRLFQSFFLGRGKAAMIVNISKTPLLFDETLQVLKFAAIAKQVAISQTREAAVRMQPNKRASQLSKMVRQSLNSSGRLSLPWGKGTTSFTFGNSEEVSETVKEEEEEDEEEEEEEERYEALIQLISKLKEELLKVHQEKVGQEERLRQELCTEFSQQMVEIENSWSQRLRDQQNRFEELTEWKLQALMKSVKKCNGNKRMRCEEDPDEEYVSSLLYFQEQHKVEEQKKHIDELEAEDKHLREEVEALKSSQKKTSELLNRAQQENSKLTFKLAQLTHNYDRVTKDIEELKQFNTSSTSTENLIIEELRTSMKNKSSQLAERDKEIMELKSMLLEASDYYLIKEEECLGLEKKLEASDKSNAQQMMHISELESQLEGARAMLSERAVQVEERDQDIDDLRNQLSQESSTHLRQLERKEEERKKLEENFLKEKTKLLLEVAELKRNKPQSSTHGTPEELREAELRAAKLQAEKEAIEQERECLSNELTESRLLFTHLQKANSTLENDFAALEKQRNELQESVSELSTKLMTVMEERASEQLDTSTLQAQSESAMNQVNTLQDRLLEKEALLAQLQESSSDQDNISSELKEKVQQLEGKLKTKNREFNDMKERYDTLSKEKEQLQKRGESLRAEQDELNQELHAAEERHRLELEKETLERKNQIESMEKEIVLLKKESTKKDSEIETQRTEKESRITDLENELKQSTSQQEKMNTEIEILSREILEMKDSSDALNSQLEEAHSSLKEKEDTEAKLQKRLNNCEAELEEMQESQASLRKENESLMVKLQDQVYIIDKLNTETEIVKKKDKCVNTESFLCDELATKTEELEKVSVELRELKREMEDMRNVDLSRQEATAKEVSILKDTNTKLESQMKEMNEEKIRCQTRVEMLELDKREMGERLDNLRETNLLQASRIQSEVKELEKKLETLTKGKDSLQSELEANHKALSEKNEVIMALSGKVESLDAKLTRADQELEEKSGLGREVAAAKEKVTSLQQKCELLEKEVCALREARQEEAIQSTSRLEDHEEVVRLKEEEISNLQQEVKRLLQMSMSSTTSEVPPATPVKVEAPSRDTELLTLREQVKLSAAKNDTLMQEVSMLRTQVQRQSSVSESSVQQVSASKPQKGQRDTSMSDVESITTPVLKEHRGKRTNTPALTPSDSLNLVLDSSAGEESQCHPAPSAPATLASSRPHRATRRTARYDSQEYELSMKTQREEDKEWEPALPSKRPPRSNRRTLKSKTHNSPNPYLKDQENKSIMANKVHSLPSPETPQPEVKKASSQKPKQRRTLYSSNTDEPFQCSPTLVADLPPEDSPRTIVRRQLRNKKK